jgi:hypothetical protein
MFTMSAKRESTPQEFENNSHIAKKKKAVSSQFHKKNFKDIVDLIDTEDEDEQNIEQYARFIK